ncbi:MAG: CapA family protein [Bacilli bacterium]|nr:CapA family protein [Bacilli bacterium]
MKLRRLTKIFGIVILILIITGVTVIMFNKYLLNKVNCGIEPEEEKITEPVITSITISAVGDCTIGSDAKVGSGWNNFNSYLKNEDYGYYFRGVYDVLSKDDITIANLEGTFTDETEKAVKTFNFKNTKDYVKVLTEGSVEIVNTANNHTYDYKEKGYQDTIEVLNDAKLPYYGYTTYAVEEIKGIKIGFAGLNYYDERNYENYQSEVDAAIEYLKNEKVDLIIFTFHWGIEATYKQTDKQVEVGRYAIDKGADLVLGHHPHRIQGIEKYNNKYIVYSLSNFVFGGHRNPKDKDSFIYQETFTFSDNLLSERKVNIIPVSISGENNLNNYQPVVLSGSEKQRVIEKLNKYSVNFEWREEN